jgi:hypothetical protein
MESALRESSPHIHLAYVDPADANGEPVLVPPNGTLSAFALKARRTDGIAIDKLARGTVVIVQTRNSQYRLIVVNGRRNKVLVEGGTLFPEVMLAHLQGASLGGSPVQTGWIGEGLRMELRRGSERIVTSPVESVCIL